MRVNDELRRLQELRESGELTDAEFKEGRDAILQSWLGGIFGRSESRIVAAAIGIVAFLIGLVVAWRFM